MDLKQSLDSLCDLKKFVKDRKLYEIVIHDRNASIDVSYEDSTQLVKEALILFNSLDAGGIAFVADNDLLFALCRQLQMQISNEKVLINVFRYESTAMQWLTEIISMPQSAA